MKTFLFIFLAGYAVKCDDSYYVVQMPDRTTARQLKVYWNVPTMQCKSKRIPFNDLFEKYGIIQNTNDTHRGDQISILYDPGFFPALIKNESTGEIRYRNGGVPQQGDLMEHLKIFKHEMEKSIPDEKFNGVGIIDFESWRPLLRQNFGVLTPYKDVSYDIEKKRHWWWKKQWIIDEAKRRFESAGRDFMQTTLALAKKMRPKALWGYYGYPQCFNRPYNSSPEKCAKDMPGENDATDWLWSESTALYPSVYSAEGLNPIQLAGFIRGRIKESVRVRDKGSPILPYWWFRYRDGGYFTETDLEVAFSTFYKSNVTGFIIWGSSKDVNTVEKCIKLKKYVTDILGPTLAKYTKPILREEDELIEFNHTNDGLETVTKIDPEYQWIPPENYSQNIEQIAEEEFNKDIYNNFDKTKQNESALIDLVLHKIADFCADGGCPENNKTKGVTTETPAVLTTKDPFKETTVKYISIVSTTTEAQLISNYTETNTSTTTTENYNFSQEKSSLATTENMIFSQEKSSTFTTENVNFSQEITSEIPSTTTTYNIISTSETTTEVLSEINTIEDSYYTTSAPNINYNEEISKYDTTKTSDINYSKEIEENYGIYDTKGTVINSDDENIETYTNVTLIDDDESSEEIESSIGNTQEIESTTNDWNVLDYILKNVINNSKEINNKNDAIDSKNSANNINSVMDNKNSEMDNAKSELGDKDGTVDYVNSEMDNTKSETETTPVYVSTEKVAASLSRAAHSPAASSIMYLVIYLRSIIVSN